MDPELQKRTPTATEARLGEDSGWVTIGSNPSGSGSSWGGQEGKGWGPAAAFSPTPPLLERSAPQASRRALSLGRLEQEASCEVHCSLARR